MLNMSYKRKSAISRGIVFVVSGVSGAREKSGWQKCHLMYRSVLVTTSIFLIPLHTFAAPIPERTFNELASRCAPTISPAVLEAVAKAESDFAPWTLHDNTTGQRETVSSQSRAEADAKQWLSHGDSVDIGLMQINSENLSALGLTLNTALDPCASLAAGAALLRAAYGGGQMPTEQQAALLMALSRYNTGSPFRGIMNGYAYKVLVDAEGTESSSQMSKISSNSVEDPNLPPSWNVSQSGVYAETHGAPWLISLTPESQLTSLLR